MEHTSYTTVWCTAAISSFPFKDSCFCTVSFDELNKLNSIRKVIPETILWKQWAENRTSGGFSLSLIFVAFLLFCGAALARFGGQKGSWNLPFCLFMLFCFQPPIYNIHDTVVTENVWWLNELWKTNVKEWSCGGRTLTHTTTVHGNRTVVRQWRWGRQKPNIKITTKEETRRKEVKRKELNISAALKVPMSRVASIIHEWKKWRTSRTPPGAGPPPNLSHQGRSTLVREVTKNLNHSVRAPDFLYGERRTF